MFPDRRLSPPPPGSGWSFGGSSRSASGSPPASPASPRRLSLGTSDALSVEEPAQRFSCSRRLVLAASPIYLSAEDRVFKNKTHTEPAATDTPSMCMLSLPGCLAPGSALCGGGRLGSCPWAPRTRRVVRACPRDVSTAGLQQVLKGKYRNSLTLVLLHFLPLCLHTANFSFAFTCQ